MDAFTWRPQGLKWKLAYVASGAEVRRWGIFAAAMVLCVIGDAHWTKAASTTTTTLTLSASSVSSGTAVTFTASVSNGSAVTLGTVNFCDTTLGSCATGGLGLLRTAQLTSAGTAIVKITPGIGTHSYEAIFLGTSSNTTSTSSAQPLTVTGTFATTTSMSFSGTPIDYTLSGTVTAAGGDALTALAGSVSFQDTSNSNYIVGSAALGSVTVAQSFASQVTYASGTAPYLIAVADFNGDGKLDVAVANHGSNNVIVYLGNGDGTFQAQATYATGANPVGVVAGDFNGDGNIDLAVANAGANSVSILLGNGNGTFQTQVSYATSGAPDALAVGDFNGDGKLDIATANFTGTASVFLGNGDGTFQTQVSYNAGTQSFGIAVGDFNGDGRPDLAVANYNNGSSGTASILLGNGDGTFQTQVSYATGNGPVNVAVGDFNGDGKLDLAVSNSAGSVSVLLGNGDGTFQTQVAYTSTLGARYVVVGDFNGDGKPDLAATNQGGSTVSVFIGNGDGTFQGQSLYSVSLSPYGLAAGDFNGDGNTDLVVSNSGSNTIGVMLNLETQTATATQTGVSIPGSGTAHLLDASYPGNTNFSSSTSSTASLTSTKVTTALALTASPTESLAGQSVTLSATLTPSSAGALTTSGETVTFKNGATTLGTGTLSAAGVATLTLTTLPSGADSLTAVYPGDTNFLTSTSSAVIFDVAAVSTTTLTLSASSVAAGTAVTFTAAVSNGANVTTGTVSFCDTTLGLCTAGELGLVRTAQLTSAGTAVVKIVPGIGSHSYKAIFTADNLNQASTSSAQVLTVTGTYPTTTAISSSGSAGNYTLTGTVVGAGSLSLAPTGSVSFLDTTNGNYVLGSASLGSASAAQTFASAVTYATGVGPNCIAVGDFNGDGKLDMAVANWNTNTGTTLSVLLGNGDGTFQSQVVYTVGTGPFSVAAADLNGDGKLDLIVANGTSATVGVLLGNGDGTFGTMATFPSGGSQAGADSLAIADFNGDGKLDVALTNYNNATLYVLLGNGDGTLQSAVGYPVGNNPYSAVAADVNGDGKLDLVVANRADSTISVLLGNGDGTFQSQVTCPASNPYSIAVGDFNGDGKLDLAVANGLNDTTVGILLGNGNGTFQSQVTYSVGTNPTGVAVADFNHDGKADLAVSNSVSGTISVLLGNGDGTFQTQTSYAAGADPGFMAAGDFNGDGWTDLATPNGSTGATVSVLLNSVTQTATASVSGVSIPGSGTAHLADASYAGNANFTGSTSNTASLTSTLATTAVALAANPASSTYGQTVTLAATLTPSTAGALTTNGETITFKNGSATLGTATLAAGVATLTLASLPAGTDTLTAVYSGDTNFAPSASSNSNFTVNQAALTVTAQNASSIYGSSLPSFTANITGFVNGDTQSVLIGAPSLTTTATAASPVGAYVITAAAGTLAAANYSFTFVNATLTVNRAVLTVAAQNAGKIYGSANPAFTASYSGFVNGDTQSVVTGAPSLTTTATAASPVGAYPITVAAGTLAATNYSFMFVSGTLTISQATPLITWTTPPGIVFGTALSGTQLDATASVPGTFAYTPSAGSTPPAGTDTLSVVFTPTDTIDYTNATASVNLTVEEVSTTTLTLSASTVTSGTVVTLTAAVTNGANVTTGLVTFCNATATHCDNGGVVGTAQLTPAGTAAIRLVPGIGSHSYKAVFHTTTANAGSSSSPQSLTVTGMYPTTTGISSSGTAGNYELTASVVGTGSVSLSPTGSVSFMDTNNGNLVLGSPSLGPATLAQTFASQVAYATGSSPQGVVVRDFNGDGYLDLAVANQNANTVSVLLGNGDGTFRSQATYATDILPRALAVGDFNGDGNLDLAVTNATSGTVSVLLGNGDGTFQSQVSYGTGSNCASIAVGDLNGDGNADLAVGCLGGTVSVLLGNGDGTFQPQVGYPVSNPNSVALGDFNGDGKLDLAATNGLSGTVSVLLGNGDGTLQAPVAYAVGTSPFGVTVADFNGDGKADLAVANFGSNTLSVLLGNGDGTFQSQVTYAAGSGPRGVSTGDFNGDGNADLAVSNLTAGTLSVLLGNGDGTLQAQAVFPAGSSPIGIATGDFNGDGNPDLVAANSGSNTLSVLLNAVTQTATATLSGVSIPGSSGMDAIEASYTGDANFNPSTSATIPLTSTPVTTELTLAANPASSTYGQPVTLTATLTPFAAGGLTTSGEAVTFKNGATTLGTGTLSAAGVATLTLSTLPAGTDALSVVYAGDANFVGCASAVTNFAVAQATLTVTAQPASSTYGSSLPTFTSVTTGFLNGDAPSVVTGASSLTTTATASSPAGAYPITAAVGTLAAANYTFAFVNSTLTINPAVLTVTAQPASSVYGSPIPGFTAIISGFVNGDTLSVVSGSASLTSLATSGSPVGMYTITAAIGTLATPNYTFAFVNGTLTIGQATPVIAWATPAPITFGTALGAAQLNASASVAGTFVYSPPAGTIPAAGTATLSVTFTPADTTDYTTASGSVTLSIGSASTTTSLISNANPVVFGAGLTLTATVTSSAGVPGGSVTFVDGSTTLGTSTLNGTGVATFAGSLSPGLHLITASYGGASNYIASTSFVLAQLVQQSVGVVLTSSGSPAQLGSSVTFTATIVGGVGTPTGSVAFTDSGALLGTGTLAGSGVATFLTSSLALGAHSITATYGGDANFAGAVSLPLAQVVQQPTTVALTSNSSSVLVGANVTFTATVSGVSAIPTGSVVFQEGGTVLGTGVLDGTGKTTYSTVNLGLGVNSIVAAYGGDAESESSSSLVYAQSVQETTNTVVTSNNSPSLTGSPVTFTATVSTSGSGSPTGNVTFLSGTTSLGSATLSGNQAMFVITSLQNGTQSITAVYSGDAANLGSTSPAILQIVEAVTNTPLTSSSNPSVSGQSVTFTATVPVTGLFTPTGTITFQDGGTPIGTSSLSTIAGVPTASFATSALTAGVHSITAAYSGDANNAPSTSAPIVQIVEAGTTVILTSSANPALLGAPILFSASVPAGSNGQPTGAVTFLDNGNQIGVGTLNGSGNASLVTSSLALGSQSITAVYSGDALNAPSTSPILTQTVLEQTQIAIASSVNPSQPGTPVTFTATVTTTGPGTPTGAVNFNDGSTMLGTASLTTAGGITTAAFTTSSLTALGEHSITAVYPGDGSNAPSTTSPLIQNVAQTTMVAITSSGNPALLGTLVTLTATVTPADGTTPTGTVTFKDDSTTLGVAGLNGSGSASLAVSSFAPGLHSITALYGGDIDSGPSSSNAFVQTIQQTTTTTLTVNANPAISGSSITFTAMVTPAVSGTPTGSVTFEDGTTALGSRTLNGSGVATLTISTLALGSHTISAVYAGDALNVTSTSASIVQVVEENTLMTLTANSNPSPFGVFVTFTATVTPQSSGTPTGSVTFLDGTSTLGTAQLNGSGVATYATQSLGVGVHSIVANYGGDSDDIPSSATLSLTIAKATPVITWATPAPISYGTALSGSQLNATASVPGTFVYSPVAGTTPVAGNAILSVTFTPTDTADYTTAISSVILTVNKVTPTIAWATPSAVVFGTVLSAAQLNATASVAGTFAYSPAAGTTPAIGNDTLSVTFTPTDGGDYTTAMDSVTLVVSRNTPATISATSGASQSAYVNLPFGTLLQAQVKDAANIPVPGVSVTFTAPASGASGTFATGGSTFAVLTDSNGLATASAFAANATIGAYNVSAAVAGVAAPANFALANTVDPGYSISANPASVTIAQGQSGSITVTLTPVGGFAGTVQLTCAGLPAYATCTFAPASAVLNGSNTQVPMQLTIDTSAATANALRIEPRSPFGPLAIPQTALLLIPGMLAGLAVIGLTGKRRAANLKLMPRFSLGLILLLAAAGIATVQTGCSSGGNTTSTPPSSSTPTEVTPVGSYSVTVMATASGSSPQTVAVTAVITQ